MNAVLWVLQVLLAAAFAAHGLMMLAPPPEIAAQMNAVLPRWFSLFIGVAEVLAAIGITVPGITRIQPQLVSWSAWGLAFVMISATLWHVIRAEYGSAGITLVLLAMACYVAYMRSRVMPIQAKRLPA